MKLRTYAPGDEKIVTNGLIHLCAARECFKRAGAPKTLQRVLLAISSAKGAQRHVETLRFLDQHPRPKFNIGGTVTGRFSSTAPNIASGIPKSAPR